MAISAPIPRLPPVTSATLSDSGFKPSVSRRAPCNVHNKDYQRERAYDECHIRRFLSPKGSGHWIWRFFPIALHTTRYFSFPKQTRDIPTRVRCESQQQYEPPEHEDCAHPWFVTSQPESFRQNVRSRGQQDVQSRDFRDAAHRAERPFQGTPHFATVPPRRRSTSSTAPQPSPSFSDGSSRSRNMFRLCQTCRRTLRRYPAPWI